MKAMEISFNHHHHNDVNDEDDDKHLQPSKTTTTTTTTVYRQMVLDPKRHRFHNKVAIYLTVGTLVLLLTLSVLFSEYPSTEDDDHYHDDQQRWLEDTTTTDYSNYSCRYLYNEIPNPGKQQCEFAKTCNGGDGIWASWVFCYNSKSTNTKSLFTTWNIFWMISPIMLLWMITLFRLLGSTAEDYFSPSLEMFSVKLGLPPRFAGVSLLALGNGAADVSATMSAMVNDETNGYKLSLGALSGAAMLIGGVVAGMVVLVAEGVPCRGALVRDVSALMVTIIVVWVHLSSGEVGPNTITLFLSMYGVFVCLVLAADVYHRAVVLPRIQSALDQLETQRQIDDARIVVQDATAAAGTAGVNNNGIGLTHPSPIPTPTERSAVSRLITSISNYDNPSIPSTMNTTTTTNTPLGWGIDSSELENDRPIILHGQHGILHGDGTAAASGSAVLEISGATTPPRTGTGTGTGVAAAAGTLSSPDRDGSGGYTLVEDDGGAMDMDRICVDGTSPTSFSASSWKGAFYDGKQDVLRHVNEVWEDIAWNGDLQPIEKFLLFCEFPFTVLRKATVPVPVEGYYNRGIVAVSLAMSPLWFAYYLWNGHDTNLFRGDSCWFFLTFWFVTVVLAVMVVRFAPGGEGNMAIGIAAPLALYGFMIAATWIDFIADQLVGLLDFMGIVLHIPSSIMGLTVLAWGNSMGDLSANITMAKKGLANMAMTACFAGPVFNILIGLGLGFSSLAAKTGNPEFSVSLTPSVLAGFVFILLNCSSILVTGFCFGKGRIESYYGYTALGLYTLYLVTSITLQLSN